jgi:C1A family cysteine protease
MMSKVYGWRRELPDHRDFMYSMHAECLNPVALPPKVDLRAQMSPVENQSQLGSCVANATCGALEFLELLGLKSPDAVPEEFSNQFEDISRLFIYYNARTLDGTTAYDWGTYLRSAVKAIRLWGICREKLWPYNISQYAVRPDIGCYTEAFNHKILTGYRVDNSQLNQMKQAMAQGYPVMFGMSVYESFESRSVFQSGMVPMPNKSERLMGGHAMCCVGYDDSMGHFIVRNSWGAQWGDKGYCYIPYEYLNSLNLASDFWTLRTN